MKMILQCLSSLLNLHVEKNGGWPAVSTCQAGIWDILPKNGLSPATWEMSRGEGRGEQIAAEPEALIHSLTCSH